MCAMASDGGLGGGRVEDVEYVVEYECRWECVSLAFEYGKVFEYDQGGEWEQFVLL